MRSILLSATLGVALLGPTACASPQIIGGHRQIERATMKDCPECAKGMAGESVWCEHCQTGFVGGENISCHGCYKAQAHRATYQIGSKED